MIFPTKYITPDIKLSAFNGKFFKTEALFEHHLLVWLISGETKIILADATHLFRGGDIFLISRRQLATIINYSFPEIPHKAVAMHLTTERLTDFYKHNGSYISNAPQQNIYRFTDHPLLKSCLNSLLPYFDMQEEFPENIAALKITEAISILRVIDVNIDNILGSFEQPGKLNLAEFMEKNFMFNMPLGKFGYLTGRSLSTFNRDFKNHYKTTPQKWLTQKRLELAHYQLAEKKMKPVEVYFETGFENLSHFSFAFKKHFGYSPTEVTSRLEN